MIDTKAVPDCCVDPRPYMISGLVNKGLLIFFLAVAGFLIYKNRKDWKRCLAIAAISLCLIVLGHYAINAIYVAIDY